MDIWPHVFANGYTTPNFTITCFVYSAGKVPSCPKDLDNQTTTNNSLARCYK